MKRCIVAVAVAAMAVALPTVLADEAVATRTLTGEYVWNYQKDNPGDLEAVFTPTGDGTWDVAFNFEFNGKAHTYSGTAEGTIGEGKLEGKVQNEEKKRTFTFAGSFDGGTFKGTHSELNGEGKPFDTGTLTLQ